MTTPATDTQMILRKIESWSVSDQIALAHLILRRARANGVPAQRPMWRQLAGLASADHQPPSDEEVARWLAEYRDEKYG